MYRRHARSSRKSPSRAATFVSVALITTLAGACATLPKKSMPELDVYHLPHDTVGGREGSVSLKQGAIVDARTGEEITVTALRQLLARYDVIHVGENHASQAHQDWEAAIIALAAAAKRPLAVGLEMLPRSVQPILDSRTRCTSERDFVLRLQWAKHWGHNYRYYRPIFRVTGRRQIPLVALNAPSKLPRTIARKGLAKLPPKLRELLPPRDMTSEAHRRLFRALLGPMARASAPSSTSMKKTPKAHPPKASSHDASKKSADHPGKEPADHPGKEPADHPKRKHRGHPGLTGDRLARYYAAQVVWDATMADSVLRWRERVPEARVVILAGVGHVMYDLGISRQLRKRAPGLRQLIVLPVRVPKGAHRLVSRQAADILIGVPEPRASEGAPALGVELEEAKGGVTIKALTEGDTPARRAGLRPGDRLVAIAGAPIATVFDVRWALLEAQRGHLLPLQIARASKRVDVIVGL